MRQSSFPGQTILGDGGENLPTVLREICADPKRRTTMIDWVRTLTPMDDPANFYFFEEIDNGIHPARQWLLLELIEKQTAKGAVQVVTTSHSPGLLTSINDMTFRNTSVVCRPEDATDAIIRPVAELPDAEKLRTSQGLGRLLMGGWMEDMIAFTEDTGGADA